LTGHKTIEVSVHLLPHLPLQQVLHMNIMLKEKEKLNWNEHRYMVIILEESITENCHHCSGI
jgi:hypothetical protein